MSPAFGGGPRIACRGRCPTVQPVSIQIRIRVAHESVALTLQLAHPVVFCKHAAKACAERVRLTWVPCAAVGTRAVPRDRLDQLLQCPLVARLLALVQGRSHGCRYNERSHKEAGLGSARACTRTARGGPGCAWRAKMRRGSSTVNQKKDNSWPEWKTRCKRGRGLLP